jgi:hypothetical protein
MYRQGDVLIVPVAESAVVGNARERKPNDRVVLAYGEVTGHAHALHQPNVCASYKEGADEYDTSATPTFIKVNDSPAPLVHEEHDTINLPPGAYKIVHQREYDMMEGVRKVAD